MKKILFGILIGGVLSTLFFSSLFSLNTYTKVEEGELIEAEEREIIEAEEREIIEAEDGESKGVKERPVNLLINGNIIDYPDNIKPLFYNSQYYLPVQFLSENLDAGVIYSNNTNELIIMSKPNNTDLAEIKVWEIKYLMKVGYSKEYIIELLGEEPSLVFSDDEDNSDTVWRYDIGAISGYEFEEKSRTADIESLEKGDIKAQLYIGLKEDKINSIFVANKSGENKIYLHYVFPDGSISGGLYE
ncbi:hypothetical protein [Chengkuizengella marina]|uniref:Copper amine oxidase N-terminal domain-containing protein n=1 Tax=Chengkuizengella marina TaxID=2507566 RepID=A0A6N9Q2M6_9BACL|nr:hypothetical protein [Chengkuizengella marina]NBI29044.1 hypothetical protein [Chengkuizengella marina]